ncbi:GntR family transcriptional regulator [Dictyobacter sp. S3.2.2.5]|uniref:GntR family transcriptional regulator n=1 Tax=Dictyobacter halimunensis TaxID=3026934 RepID=A0ABQ6FLA7_9CHLR|nr:GntR family transcriptional regulator [Dictyobacter sp. S3.2.2.5]
MQRDILSVLGLWTQDKGPLYQRLATALRRAIETTALQAHTRLPAERVLARKLGVSRTTVVAAYQALEAEGWIERRHGSGTRVCQVPASHSARVRELQTSLLAHGMVYDAFLAEQIEQIDLATGAVAWPQGISLQPYLPTADTLAPLVQDYGYIPRGFLPLRQAIAHYFRQRGVPTTADQILVTTGAQQAIQLLASCCLQHGDVVHLETPTFFGLLDVVRSLGLRCVALPVTQDGLDMLQLRQQIISGAASWLFLQPTLHNPTGSDLSLSQRRSLLQWASEYGVTVVEDLTMADLRWAGSPLAPLAALNPERTVITLGSLSKSVWGGMRIGWVRAPVEMIARLARFKTVQDLGSSLLAQVMATALLNDLDTFLVQRLHELRERQAYMETYLRHHLPDWQWHHPSGGLFLWVQLPTGEARDFTQEALRHDVLITPGPMLSVNEEYTRYIRLSYICEPAQLLVGLTRLEQAWKCYLTRLEKHQNPGSALL